MSAEDRASYLDMMDYFWDAKGDLERYTGWNEILVEREFPALAHAWKNFKASKALMDAVIKGLK